MKKRRRWTKRRRQMWDKRRRRIKRKNMIRRRSGWVK